MKKVFLVLFCMFILFSVSAQETNAENSEEYTEAENAEANKIKDSGFVFYGGVKTGILIKNSDFGGKLGDIALGEEHKYPMTFYFASFENNSRIGEAWLNAGYNWDVDKIGKFGFQMGFWAHGDVETVADVLHIGDYFLWGNFFSERLCFIGGKGGGSPISSGGWINTNWLSYTGLRLFWVDPIGISAGLIFPDPGAEGIKPVNYLSLLGAGISYKYKNWWISLQFINSPIYDDSESNYYGGLRRPAEQDPIGQAGNISFGTGIDNLYRGKGSLSIEALFTNLGEDENVGWGKNYTISPIASTFAFKTGIPLLKEKLLIEIKAKYILNQGDDAELTRAIYWGKLEIEPYISYTPFHFLSFSFAFNGAFYFDSYYLALEASPTNTYTFSPGQVPGYSPLLDYLSPYQLTFKPKVTLMIKGIDIDFGYKGIFSRDHVENIIFLDFRWMY